MHKRDWIYRTDQRDRYRFVLGVKGSKMLAIIGANPSTANPEKSDRTVARIDKIARKHGYDGWVLYNLWPERKTHPDELRKYLVRAIHKQNLIHIQDTLQQYPVTGIWAAWGNIIEKRPYLYRCLTDICRLERCKSLSWFQLNTLTGRGHPRHPLYQPDHSVLTPFHIQLYTEDYPR